MLDEKKKYFEYACFKLSRYKRAQIKKILGNYQQRNQNKNKKIKLIILYREIKVVFIKI